MKRLIVSVSVALALCTAASLLVAQDAEPARARVLLAKVPLIDGHNDLPRTLRESFAGDPTGWSDDDLEKLAGGNLLRVLRAAEATANRLAARRPPSTATIELLDAKKAR
ncbi:MAG TPA: hypothetical protein VFT39_24130 [Vicinamibacterales bacterium]|nr:hypothetical protein [Vicinamibacterales bacterium]